MPPQSGSQLNADAADAEAKLRAMQERYQALFASSPGMLWITDAQGHVLNVNVATAVELGYAAEDLIGRPLSDLVQSEDREELQRNFAECFKRPGEVQRWNLRKLRRDGTLLTVRASARAVRNASGQFFDVMLVCEGLVARQGFEDTLPQTRQLLESIIDHIPHMVFLKAAKELRYVLFNTAGEELTGVKQEALIGKNDFDFWPREQAEFFTNMDREVLADGNLMDIPAEPIQTKYQGIRWLHTKKLPLYDSNGQPAYLLGISEDITDRKGREEIERLRLGKLEAQQAALHALAENPSIHSGQPQYAFPAITEQAARTCGVARAGIWLFNDTQSALIAQDLYEATVGSHTEGTTLSTIHCSAYVHALATEPYSLAAHDARTDTRTRELLSSFLIPNGIGAMLDAPIRRHGRVVGVLSLGHVGPSRTWTTEEQTFTASLAALATLTLEAADRRQSQEALERRVRERTNELRRITGHLQTIIEESPLAMIELDYMGLVTTWNAAASELFGWSKEEVMGQSLPSVLPGDKHGAHDLWTTVMSGAGPRNLELRRLRKDGSFVDVAMWGSPLQGPGGQPIGVIGFFVDVTPHRQLEDQLRQAHKMEAIGRLAGGIAHDFNNLLTVINGCATLVLNTTPAENTVRRLLNEILTAGQRAAALTGQLLAVSRRQVLTIDVFDVNIALSTISSMIERLIGEDIELVRLLDARPCTIRADKGQIDQVVMNLAINAKDAMPHGGTLTIETQVLDINADTVLPNAVVPAGMYAHLSVRDTGQGMNRATLSHIFEPFFTTKEEGKGTGLGLATVYGIVQQCHGFIFADSKPGEGSTFDLYFPLVSQSSASAPSLAARPSGGKETILLVEDQTALRQLLTEALSHYGYTVLEASSGQEALRMVAATPNGISILITDIVMAQMTGPTLATQLRRQLPDLPVLFMSGYVDADMQPTFLSEPGTAFIQKPFVPEDLAKKLRELLDSTG